VASFKSVGTGKPLEAITESMESHDFGNHDENQSILPDDSGILYQNAVGLGLASCRLFILFLSTEGRQAMFSPQSAT
jgi:hypothetical protein